MEIIAPPKPNTIMEMEGWKKEKTSRETAVPKTAGNRDSKPINGLGKAINSSKPIPSMDRIRAKFTS